MEFNYNEQQEMIREMARKYAQEQVAPRIEEIESADKFPEDLFRILKEMGFMGINLPEKYGGMDLGFLSKVIMLEEISKVSPSLGTLLAVSLLPLEAILAYGTDEQKDAWLADGIQGKYKASFAFTEADTGSDPKMLTTVAKKQQDGTYRINGMKRFISNAAYEGPIVLFCKEAETGQCTAFIIKKFTKGYSLSTPWKKVGLQGSHIYDVFFDDVVAKEEDILGAHGQGFEILIGATAYGKMDFSAVFTGAMDGAYELAVKYAKEKKVRDKPISKFQTIQVNIARIAANVKAAKLLLFETAYEADTISDVAKVQGSTALLKGYIADVAPETTLMSLNILASYGVTEEYQVERLMRDTLIAPNVEGAGDVQRIISGNYILRH